MESENSRLKVRLKGNLYIYKCFIDVWYIFDSSFQEEFGNAPERRHNFSVNFCHLLSRFYLLKRIHDPVSARWIAFNGKLMSFRGYKFSRNNSSVYFFLFAGILTCVSAFLRASLLRRCQRILYNFYFRVQQLVNFIWKYVTRYSR